MIDCEKFECFSLVNGGVRGNTRSTCSGNWERSVDREPFRVSATRAHKTVYHVHRDAKTYRPLISRPFDGMICEAVDHRVKMWPSPWITNRIPETGPRK